MTRPLVIFILTPFLLVWGLLLYGWIGTPPVLQLRLVAPTWTSYISRYSQKTGRSVRWNQVPIEQISPWLQQAVVCAEDDQFFVHPGFNVEAIKRAWRIDQRRKRLAFGGSTITQQLARNLFLTPDKNFWRKFQELLIALKLELFLPKVRILELYLNVAEWGPGVFGAEQAARYHFAKSAIHLTRSEAAYLAAIIPRAAHLKPGQTGYVTREKMNRILRQM